MHIRIVYYNGSHDYVTAPTLSTLLSTGRVKAFFRPLVRRWAHVGYDRVRGEGGMYSGTERRQVDTSSGEG
jgi:hypothetical protein